MSLKDKLKAKSAGLGAMVDAELANPEKEARPSNPRTGIGQASAFQLAMAERDSRIAELEAGLGSKESSMIPLEAISPNPWQPRRVFDEAEIRSLADSIGEVGLIQPVVVRVCVPPGSTAGVDSGRVPPGYTFYELVAGERRLRAHRLLGLNNIKAVVIKVSDADMAIMALAENIDRADLTDYEISLAIRRAEKDFPNRKKMAESLGMTRSELYRYLSFDQLPEFVLLDLEALPGLLSRKSAHALQTVLSTLGPTGTEALRTLWPQIKSGTLEHPRLADAVANTVLRGKTARTDRDIKKLFIGKEQAGSITRDASALTVKIRTAAITSQKESRLRAFVQQLLVELD